MLSYGILVTVVCLEIQGATDHGLYGVFRNWIFTVDIIVVILLQAIIIVGIVKSWTLFCQKLRLLGDYGIFVGVERDEFAVGD